MVKVMIFVGFFLSITALGDSAHPRPHLSSNCRFECFCIHLFSFCRVFAMQNYNHALPCARAPDFVMALPGMRARARKHATVVQVKATVCHIYSSIVFFSTFLGGSAKTTCFDEALPTTAADFALGCWRLLRKRVAYFSYCLSIIKTVFDIWAIFGFVSHFDFSTTFQTTSVFVSSRCCNRKKFPVAFWFFQANVAYSILSSFFTNFGVDEGNFCVLNTALHSSYSSTCI